MVVHPSTRTMCALHAVAILVAAGCGSGMAGGALPVACSSHSGVDVNAGAEQRVRGVALPRVGRANSTEIEASRWPVRVYRLRPAAHPPGDTLTLLDHRPSANGELPFELRPQRVQQDQDVDPGLANLEEAPHGG